MADFHNVPQHLGPWLNHLPNGWPDAGGSVPDEEAVELAVELGASSGTKFGLAWVMYCRPEGATRGQVTEVCGGPQNNRANEAAQRGELTFTKKRRDDGKTV